MADIMMQTQEHNIGGKKYLMIDDKRFEVLSAIERELGKIEGYAMGLNEDDEAFFDKRVDEIAFYVRQMRDWG